MNETEQQNLSKPLPFVDDFIMAELGITTFTYLLDSDPAGNWFFRIEIPNNHEVAAIESPIKANTYMSISRPAVCQRCKRLVLRSYVTGVIERDMHTIGSLKAKLLNTEDELRYAYRCVAALENYLKNRGGGMAVINGIYNKFGLARSQPDTNQDGQ